MTPHLPRKLGALLAIAGLVAVVPVLRSSQADAAGSSVRRTTVAVVAGPATAASAASAPATAASAPVAADGAVMVGAQWDGPRTVQVRAEVDGAWSPWMDLRRDTEEHLPDPDSAELGRIDTTASEPVWVGQADRLQFSSSDPGPLNVALVTAADAGAAGRPATAAFTAAIPADLAAASASPSPAASPSPSPGPTPTVSPTPSASPSPSISPSPSASPTPSPSPTASPTPSPSPSPTASPTPSPSPSPTPSPPASPSPSPVAPASPSASPTPGPDGAVAPPVLRRADWGADESLRDGRIEYSATDSVRFSVVHHVGGSTRWSDTEIAGGCQRAATMIRSIYEYHTLVKKYWDIAYNFVVDPCGRIWEGRAGGIAVPVQGAHAGGFNDGSVGVLALGTFSGADPDVVAPAMIDGIERIIAYKLALDDVDPGGVTREISGGSTARVASGTAVTLPVLSAHQISNNTTCPGWRVMEALFNSSAQFGTPKASYIAGVRGYFAQQRQATAGICPPPSSEAMSFADVEATAELGQAIRCQAAYGIATGYPDGTYRPAGAVTRGQMAKFVANLIETAAPGTLDLDAENPFADVAAGGTFTPQIAALATAGIVDGVAAGRYAPNEIVTRGQMAKFVANAAETITGIPLVGPGAPSAFDDVAKGATFEPFISALAAIGIVRGNGDGQYGPGREVTRAEMAVFTIGAGTYADAANTWAPTQSPSESAAPTGP